MKGEIDKDYYCSTAGFYDCPEKGDCGGCPDKHRKYPTPEQFREKWGEEWNGAMHTICVAENCKISKCLYYMEWSDMPEFDNYPDCQPFLKRVCACTPWGKPPADWRPE